MKKERGNRMLTFLLLAGICFHLLPEMLLTIIFFIKGSSLADWMIWLCRAVGILGGMILLLPAVKIAFGEPKQKNKGMIGRFVTGGVTAAFAYLLYDAAIDLLYVPLVNLGINHTFLSIALNVLIALVFIMLQGVTVALWVAGAMPAEDIPTLKQLVKKPLTLLEVIGLVLVTNSVPTLVSWVISLLPSSIGVNVPFNFVVYLIIAALQAGGLWLVLFVMRKAFTGKGSGVVREERVSEPQREATVPESDLSAAETQVEPDQNTKKSGKLRHLPLAAVSAVGIALILIIQAITYYSEDPVDTICDGIVDAGSLSGALLVAGDIEGGLQELQNAVLILNAWGGILGMEDCPSLAQLYGDNPSSAMVAYLYFTAENRQDELARYLRVETMDPEFALAWLNMCAKDGISEQEKVLADELKYFCAATGTYTSSALKVSDLAGREERLEMELRKYLELKDQLELLELVAEVVRKGSADHDAVNAMLDYAGNHPDNWVAQYQAAVVGSSLTYDNAWHYDRTIQAAARFEELYCAENKLSDEELCGIQLKTASMIINCYGYQQAVPYLEKAADLGGLEESFSMAAQCYEALGEHEKCYELCVEMLKEDPDRLAARYYAAVNALKGGRQEDALLHTSRLATLAKETVTGDEYGADVALYAMLQFLSFNDSGNWTEYRYAFYEKMTDEQKAIVEENAFFADYLEAVYQCFGTGKSGHLDVALEAVDRVLEENDALPQAWYLKGAIYFAREEFGEAVDAYKQSLAIVPDSATTWFALANAYDGMGQYELAYEACERTMALIPVQDHGSDWYGVTVHCENLMNSLKSKVGG